MPKEKKKGSKSFRKVFDHPLPRREKGVFSTSEKKAKKGGDHSKTEGEKKKREKSSPYTVKGCAIIEENGVDLEYVQEKEEKTSHSTLIEKDPLN